MDKLTRFYLDLSMDTDKLARFNQGRSAHEISKNRKKMLKDAGIKNSNKIIALTQPQLSQLLAANIYCITGDSAKLVLKQFTKKNI